MSTEKIITYALPYANGMLHLGHILGMVQSDCYVRSQRLLGEKVLYLCGDDAHGTPIMLNAMKQEITPDELVSKYYQEHVQDIEGFNISFDGYHTTHDALNTHIVHTVYHRLMEKGAIIEKSVEQAYDESQGMFLPDRYIKGICPKCGAEDQYGDHCEVCGKTYGIKELKSPKSILSGGEPVWKASAHDFYRLSSHQNYVEKWLDTVVIQDSVKNKLKEWFVEGLMDWDITRDDPYFGIGIPNKPGKYFYVWLDAPFGYLTSLGKTLGLETFEDVALAWNCRQVEHFIGKDIVCFHGVFWPSVLEQAGLRVPDRLQVHGFLTMSGDKMSKSRGTFVQARAYLDKLPPDLIRYYFASRLSPSVSDIDLDWEDFVLKINADLVGKLANIGSRSQGFAHKHMQGKLGDKVDLVFWNNLIREHEAIAGAYKEINLAKVCRLVMMLCDETNQYIADKKPWVLAKSEDMAELGMVVTTAMNAFRYLSYWLSPVIPEIAEKVKECLGEETFVLTKDPLLGSKIHEFGHLVARISSEDVTF